MKVTVRYFAAAQAAAGIDDEIVGVKPGTTVAALIETLAQRNTELARVLRRCSYLCEGVAVRDLQAELQPEQTIDVLPPFAGG
ncbi:MoaD/ThiS family protein [Mycobacterium hubeiense]|uniref:MoaD/ThiS family protein n=1 Tax=Mycobacterium hubeiense TaxID=1867256 RepID=UPI000C7F48A6|nr:MoaD/ThiS family protein [Mycobacterium sp. QGD 101]